MKRASRFFVDSEKARIENAVAEAEANTAAEIVPAVATDSGRYDRAEDVAGLWLGLIAMSIVWTILRTQSAEVAQWGSNWSRLELPLLIATVAIGYMIGTVAAAYIAPIRRLFTPRRHMVAEVERRAHHLFFDQRVHHTQDATGLLVYISLFERTARLVADQAVLEKLGQPVLDELCAKLIEGIQAGDPATALCEVIQDAGSRLAEVLPRAEGDQNEIENTLVLLD